MRAGNYSRPEESLSPCEIADGYPGNSLASCLDWGENLEKITQLVDFTSLQGERFQKRVRLSRAAVPNRPSIASIASTGKLGKGDFWALPVQRGAIAPTKPGGDAGYEAPSSRSTDSSSRSIANGLRM